MFCIICSQNIYKYNNYKIKKIIDSLKKNVKDNLFFITTFVNNNKIELVVDTGANFTSIHSSILDIKKYDDHRFIKKK